MKLILGLGNIGEKYELTRHNVGFIVLDELANLYALDFKYDKDLEALIATKKINNEKVVFAKPTTYVNLSGNALSKIMKYYKIAKEDILVIYDDINLDLGRIRVRETNGHGGHNGIKDIIRHLSAQDFKRIRVGVGLDKSMPLDHYVLGKFSKNEIEILKPAVIDIMGAVDLFTKNIYFKDIMTKYNTQT
ncbi:aminoacyl-tRNA hydrolase [Haploplasma axanthum]|uniref:Peptidyl-tRNA hydrolase n=1 Tax=Haploplasma axanthum TaxID=29552 RepID=A0A449BBB6_HAPAX|nr:aminoacyl-tRNA hydrolase [Haploplasma axanthum]VEU79693.1 peptidyl-tRNA hydrolase [Haploplasma axanthum]